MNTIQFLSSQPWVERLGWTLLHFLWQGALIASLYAVARRSRIPQTRYAFSCVALAAMVAAPLVTFALAGTPASAISAHIGAVHVSSAPAVAVPVVSASLPAPATQAPVGNTMQWLVIAWFSGVILFWGRLMGGWVVAARMRSMLVRPAPLEWQQKLDRLRSRICVSRPVRLLISALVQVPTVVGWLRPVVLVAVGALAGLPSEHLKALLAHELAHIRRNDYLVNILQSIAEAFLFYHPAVWWISSEIRNDREICCDDIAVTVNGDAFTYAKALAELETHRPAHLTLAADGGSLPDRISRLLGQSRNPSRLLPGPAIAAGAALILITAYGLFAQPAPAKLEFEAASIRPSAPFVPGVPRTFRAPSGGPGTSDPGHYSAESAALPGLICDAYGIQRDQLSGPDWMISSNTRTGPSFDIVAKMPQGTSKEQFHLMLQNLLVDRFGLTFHRGTKELPTYHLVIAKNGPKFKPAPKDPASDDTGHGSASGGPALGADGFPIVSGNGLTVMNGRFRMQNNRETMSGFASRTLSNYSGRRVIDVTDLTGEYALSLYWVDDSIATADISVGPTLIDALQQQLGLKLEPAKEQVETLVVDRIEKTPTEN